MMATLPSLGFADVSAPAGSGLSADRVEPQSGKVRAAVLVDFSSLEPTATREMAEALINTPA